jgi:ferredoxin
MRVIVDHERCSGHGRCFATAPEVYALDELGYCEGDIIEVPAGFEAQAILGAESCPERALTIETKPSDVN